MRKSSIFILASVVPLSAIYNLPVIVLMVLVVKYKYVYVTRRDINDKDRFKKKIDEIATSWPPSVYMLKHPSGKIFARFRVSDGKMTLLYKTSPATGSLYPVWEFFKELA